MKRIKHLSLALLCCAVAPIAMADTAAIKPPNILFILVDDQRNDTLGCAGHPVIKTPNIDQLAKLGVRFEKAYVSMPICMASRATIFSGLTQAGHGFTGGGAPATPLQMMDVDTSFPVKLREAGYRNGFYGKQHVRFAENNNVALKRMFHDYKVYNFGGPHFRTLADGSKRHSAEVIGDRSVEFIKSQPEGQPFCLYMSFNIAHAVDANHKPGDGHFPWPVAVDGMYEDIDPAPPRLGDPKYFEMQPAFLKESLNRDRWFWRWDTPEKYKLNMRAYYRMLSGMDGVVGRVQKQLDKQGLLENTIVIYTGDNGFYMGERGFAGKWSHYEESLRVPLIIHDPRPNGGGERGRVLSPFVLNLDLPATILELAGVVVPEKYQGKSLVPYLKGEAPKAWRKDFYNEHHSSHDRIPNWRGVHGERYTYARYFDQEPVAEMLYDLETDPDQLKNLAADPKHAELLKRMRARTEEFLQTYTRPEIVAVKAEQAEKQKKNKRK
ncbi:MAG: arylsulfatase A-like enzyme [Cryomorphaceae bacterium]|jgi:arylsulfatase A-like enzyme